MYFRLNLVIVLQIFVSCALVADEGFSGSIVDLDTVNSSGIYLFKDDGTYLRLFTRMDGQVGIDDRPLETGAYKDVPLDTEHHSGALILGSEPNARILKYNHDGAAYGSFDTVSAAGGLARFLIYPKSALIGASNVSVRGWVTKSRSVICGFIVSGFGPRWVLVRVAGPALTKFDVAAVANMPRARVFYPGSRGDLVGAWSHDPVQSLILSGLFSYVGAFPFETGSEDLADLRLMAPGAYTIVAGTDENEGEVLIEAYFLPEGLALPPEGLTTH